MAFAIFRGYPTKTKFLKEVFFLDSVGFGSHGTVVEHKSDNLMSRLFPNEAPLDVPKSTGVLLTAAANMLGMPSPLRKELYASFSPSQAAARRKRISESDSVLAKVVSAADQAVSDTYESVADVLADDTSANDNSYSGYSFGRSSASGSPVAHFNYLDAPYAQAYNMSRETAYEEALANTSHQREVADLRAAGLNPVLSANGGSGASVFGGTVYAPAVSGSGLSRVSRSSSSRSDSLDYGKIIKNVTSLVDAGLTLTGHASSGRAISMAGRAVDGLLDAFAG